MKPISSIKKFISDTNNSISGVLLLHATKRFSPLLHQIGKRVDVKACGQITMLTSVDLINGKIFRDKTDDMKPTVQIYQPSTWLQQTIYTQCN